MNIFPRIATTLLTIVVLSTAGCGGGGGGGDGGGVATPPPPPPPAPPPTSGITRTGVAVAIGPITEFGSVWVNGVRYETDGQTDFFDDGQRVTQDDLSIGQMAVIQGTIDDDNVTATATSVTVEDAVEGPVTSATPVTLPDGNEVIELVVLGQTAHITAATLFDDTPQCPADLTQAMAVEIYGTPDSTGVIQATFIECRDGNWDGVMEVHGVVTGHVAGQSFMINSLTVDYSNVAVLDDDFPGGQVNNGDPIEAKGTQYDANTNTLVATSVDYEGNQFEEIEGHHIEIEGFITDFVSDTDFDVSGIPVTTIDSTVYEGGDETDLGLNVKVEVEGELDSTGVLNATKIEIKTSTAIRVLGVLDADSSGSTLTILGITINTDATRTRFEDKSGANLDPLLVGDLAQGDYLEVRGQEIPSGQITAMRVEREDSDPRTELRGFVTAADNSTLTVLAVTISTDSGTAYRDSRGETEVTMLADDFWAAVGPGVLIEARGAETGAQSLSATEIALESE